MRRGPSGPLLCSSCSALGRALVRLTPVETALCRTLQRFRYLSLLGEDFSWIVHSPSRLATPGWGANQGACAPRHRLPAAYRKELRVDLTPCRGPSCPDHVGASDGDSQSITVPASAAPRSSFEAEPTTTQRPPSRQLWKSAGSPGRGHARGRGPARARRRCAVWRDHGGQTGARRATLARLVSARRRGRGPRSGRDRGIGAGSRPATFDACAAGLLIPLPGGGCDVHPSQAGAELIAETIAPLVVPRTK